MSFSDRRSTRVPWRLLLGALCGLSACSQDVTGEGARVSRVSPGWGLTTEAVSGVIEGEHFVTVPTQHLGAGEPVTLESRFEVHLGEHRLEDVTWVDEHTLSMRVPAGLAAGWYPVTVRTPLGERVEHPQAYYASDRPLASLRVQPRTGPARMWVGEEGRLTLTVENPGGTRALGVQARLLAREPGTAAPRSQPAPQDVEPGAQAVFTWTLDASTAGTTRFTLELEGREEKTGQALSTALPEQALQVDARARPASTLSVEAPVSEGQPVFLTVHVKNPGASRLREVSTAPPLVEGGRVEWAAAPVPPHVELEPGQTKTLLWRGMARSAGSLNFKVQVAGIEDATGDAVPLTESSTAPLTVYTRGRLVAQFDALPVDIRVGQKFKVDILVNNAGQSPVRDVQLERGDLAAPHAKTCRVALVAEPTPQNVGFLPGGGRTRFSGSLKALAPGECSFVVRALAVDGVDDQTLLVSELVTSAAMAISP